MVFAKRIYHYPSNLSGYTYRYLYTEEGPHLEWTINMIRHSFISLIKKTELWNCRCDHPRTLIRSLWLASYLSIRTRLSCVSCAFRVHLPIRPHTVRHHQSERNNLTADAAAVAVQWSSCVLTDLHQSIFQQFIPFPNHATTPREFLNKQRTSAKVILSQNEKQWRYKSQRSITIAKNVS